MLFTWSSNLRWKTPLRSSVSEYLGNVLHHGPQRSFTVSFVAWHDLKLLNFVQKGRVYGKLNDSYEKFMVRTMRISKISFTNFTQKI